MFTSNYNNYKTGKFQGTTISLKLFDGANNNLVADSTVRAFCGDIGNLMKKAHCRTLAAGANSSDPLNACNPGIYFGSGITPPTVDDYTLEFPIATGLSVACLISAAMTHDRKQYRYCNTIKLTNDISVAITSAEVGLFGQAATGSSRKPVLFERTVLETPVVIEPGETKVIQYWVYMNQFLGGA